jgi:hypothetical protein
MVATAQNRKATVVLAATFDYTDEEDYARTLTELMERARETSRVQVLDVRRGDGIAADGPVPYIAPVSSDGLKVCVLEDCPFRGKTYDQHNLSSLMLPGEHGEDRRVEKP